MNKFYLKSMDIQNFKTFAGTFHIEFAQGLNTVLANSDNSVKSRLWDFFDTIRWGLGVSQHHGSNI